MSPPALESAYCFCWLGWPYACVHLPVIYLVRALLHSGSSSVRVLELDEAKASGLPGDPVFHHDLRAWQWHAAAVNVSVSRTLQSVLQLPPRTLGLTDVCIGLVTTTDTQSFPLLSPVPTHHILHLAKFGEMAPHVICRWKGGEESAKHGTLSPGVFARPGALFPLSTHVRPDSPGTPTHNPPTFAGLEAQASEEHCTRGRVRQAEGWEQVDVMEGRQVR